jgi:hypothetical protein
LQALRRLQQQSALRIHTACNTTAAIAAEHLAPVQRITLLVSAAQRAQALVRKFQDRFDHGRRNQAESLRRIGLGP